MMAFTRTDLDKYCEKLVEKRKKPLMDIAKEDEERISKTIQKDPSGREFFWNGDHFESEPDENGKTWVLGVDSSVPGFWHYCPKITGVNSKGYEIQCRTPHFVFYPQEGEKLTCRKCKEESTIEFVIPE